MGDFFKSRQFHALAVLFLALFGFLLRAVYTGGIMPFLSHISGAALVRASRGAADGLNRLDETVGPYLRVEELLREVEELREENRSLMQQMVDYEVLKHENTNFREYLELKERNRDFDIESAEIVSRSPDSRFGSFVIDVGSSNGVHPMDPVMTTNGLIGVVREVSSSHAKVSTILDPQVRIGALDIKTQDTGSVSGSIRWLDEGYCQMEFISRGSGAAVGDIITTSGASGIYPRGLIIGTIQSIESASNGLSLYALIKPEADVFGAKSVVVIKNFDGKDEYADFSDD